MKTKESKLSRREFLELAGTLGAGAVLASCAPEPAKTPAAEPTKTVEVPAVHTPTPIRFSSWWGDFWYDYAPLLEEKTNTKVTFESYPWQEYHEKIKLQMAAGEAPDIMMINNINMGDFWPSGQLLPLNDYLVPPRFDASKYYWDPVDVGGYQGEILGLDQYVAQPCVLHINKTLTDELGLTETLPEFGKDNFDEWRYDDFVEFCEAATQVKANGEVETWAIGCPMMGYWNYCTKWAVYSNGGQQYDVWWFQGDETKCLLDSPESIEAISKQIDLTLEGYAYLESAAGPIEGGCFQTGRAAAYLGPPGSQFLPSKDLDFEKTYIHAPWFKQRTVHTTGDFLCVNKASKNREAAVDWLITQITDPDVGRKFMQTMGLAPSYNGKMYYDELEEGTELKTLVGIHLSRWEGFSDYPEQAKATIHYPGHEGFIVSAFLRDTMDTAIEAALIGEKTAEQAVREAVAEINAELAAKSA